MKQRHKRKQADKSKHYRSLQTALRLIFRKNLKRTGSMNNIDKQVIKQIWSDADRLSVNDIFLKMKKLNKN